ncbi:MAG: cell division protein FtsQ/DivIB [Spirosomataceae bacterium]
MSRTEKVKKGGILLLVALGVYGLVRLSLELRQDRCTETVVEIDQPENQTYVTETEIKQYATQFGSDVLEGKYIDQISLEEVEERVRKNPHVQTCEAFIDLSGQLQIKVKPYLPTARLIKENQLGDYIDPSGYFFPTSRHFSARVLLVGGDYFVGKRSLRDSTHLELLTFLNTINNDPFWSVQFTQLDIDKDQFIHIYPLVGTYVIDFGKPVDVPGKLEKLKLYYTQLLEEPEVIPQKRIDLSISNQLVIE